MKMKNARVNWGGMLRCCAKTIYNMCENEPEREIKEGELIDCEFEPPGNEAIIFDNGVFRWNENGGFEKRVSKKE